MQNWFTSDLHLGHENIIRYTDRPFKNVDHMNEELIRRWNERVKPEDTVYHVGDFCFKNSSGGKRGEGMAITAKSWESQLNGKIIFVKGNHDCFSLDTRILTKTGYKYYNEVKIGDKIPTVNLTKKKIEYKSIKDIVFTSVKKGYEVKTRSLSGIFSANHRHLYSFGTSTNLPIKIGTSDEIWKLKSPVRLVGSFLSGRKRYNIDDNWLKLLAWIMTDGGIEKKRGYVTIYQSKIENIEYIKMLLKFLNIKYTLNTRQRNTKFICGKKLKSQPKLAYEFKIYSNYSKQILEKLSLKNKYTLPEWIPYISDKQCKLFISELIRGDGTIQNSNTYVLWGKKIFLEQIMGLCVTHNLKSNLIKDCRNSYYLTISTRKINKEEYLKYKSLSPNKRKVVDYDENMWGVNVDNHIIFIEHKGKTLVTGNSNNSCRTPIEKIGVRYGGQRINLVHNPIHVNPNYKINFVGHVHNRWQIKRIKTHFGFTDAINVGVDVHNFYPVSFEELMKLYHQWKRSKK